MNSVILGGLAAGALAVLLCTSSLGEGVRNWIGKIHKRVYNLVNCCFCTTWWISIAMLENFTLVEWASTVAVANLTVLGIHMSLGSVEDEPMTVQESFVRELSTSNGDR